MSSPFGDLADVFDPSFYFSVRGKQYQVKPPDATTGLRLQAVLGLVLSSRDGRRLLDRELKAITESQGQAVDVVQQSLGDTYDELVTDGLDYAEIRHCGMTAFFYWTQGEAAAVAYWNSRAEGNPKAPRTSSTSTDVVPTTKRRGSGSGTRSPKTRSSAGKRKRQD